MDSLWTTVATTMFQRLNLLKDLLGLYLNRQQAKALLEQVQASNLSDEARDRISQILRFMLRLPDEWLQESSSPAPPYRLAPPHRAKPTFRGNRSTPHSVVSATHCDGLGLTSFQAIVTSTPPRRQARV